jgi:hypothetical protein
LFILSVCHFGVKINGLSSLEDLFFFEFLLLPPLCTSCPYPPHLPCSCVRVCVQPIPRPRERLKSAKTRLSRDLKNRTEKRVREILSPITPESQEEICDDSEEENRLEGRGIRVTKDKGTQTESLSSSFCCGVIVGVLVVLCVLICLVLFVIDDRHKKERQR